MSRLAVCTIVSKNYLAFARTLMSSVASAHPDWHRYVLLVDELHGEIDPEREPFTLVPLSELPLPKPRQFTFRYSILELNTAVKPWLLEWLFDHGHERIVYFDPDILVCSPLHELEALFADGANVILTPHLLDPLEDGRHPSDLDILRAGTYNLGFIAVRRSHDTMRLLHWWQRRNEFDCVVDFERGLFVDQRWMDLAPGLCERVAVARTPRYNVAYWNLAHRSITRTSNGYLCNGEPLAFFHFSGFDPLDPGPFSKHQNRFRLADLGDARELALHYSDLLLKAGHKSLHTLEYTFARFTDGVPIPDSARYCYRTTPALQQAAAENPFALPHTYFNFPVFSARRGLPVVTRLMLSVWRMRPELRHDFPDLEGTSREQFARLFVGDLSREIRLPSEFVRPVAESLAGPLRRSRIRGAIVHSIVRSTPSSLRPALRNMAAMIVPPGFLERWLALASRARTPRRRIRRWPTNFRRIGAALRRVMLRLLRPAASRPHFPSRRTYVTAAAHPTSVNVIGYLSHPTGVGESARRFLAALDATRIPHSVLDCSSISPEGPVSLRFPQRRQISILHVNADQTATVVNGIRGLRGHYRIGVWHWELPTFPDEWLDRFDYLNEIWVPSRFVQDAVSPKSPIPVIRMPHCVQVRPTSLDWRARFGLPKDTFLFLSMYDFDSIQERKNPRATLAAFRAAFPQPRDAALVVKTLHADRHPAEARELKDELAQLSGVHLLEGTLSREEVTGLEESSDAFVSLHRSEGFGLVLAECMLLGKPVIATNWSGNTDFMNATNACPVDFSLVELLRDYPPYRSGQRWAEPDIEHASWHMKRLISDEPLRQRIGRAATVSIRERLAPAVVGMRYRQRLAVMSRRR